MPEQKLENLPVEVKEFMHSLIAQGLGSVKLKAIMDKKYPQLKDLLPSSRATYSTYLDRHKEEILKQRGITERLTDDEKQSVSDLQNAVDKSTDKAASVDDRRAALDQVAQGLNDQLQRIEELVKKGSLLTPQYESVMVQIQREKIKLIEKAVEFKQVLDQDDIKDLFKAYNDLMDQTMVALQDILRSELSPDGADDAIVKKIMILFARALEKIISNKKLEQGIIDKDA